MSKKHTHKYHKVLVSGVKLFACGFPDCSHHMPKHYESLLIGKASYCWKCGNRMLLDKDNMRYDFPWCLECKFGDEQGSNLIDVDVNSAVQIMNGNPDNIPTAKLSELDDSHDMKPAVKVISQHDLNDLFK